MKNNELSICALDLQEQSACQFVEQIYLSSFPLEERRDVADFWAFAQDGAVPFFIHLITSDSEPIGFISYWLLDGFAYVEHFAFAERAQGKGAGTYAMQALYDMLDTPIVLEVEPVNDEQTQRRVNFYTRLGFHLWQDIDYLQPPYRVEESSFALHLMTKGDLNLSQSSSHVVGEIYRKVYGVKENDQLLKDIAG